MHKLKDLIQKYAGQSGLKHSELLLSLPPAVLVPAGVGPEHWKEYFYLDEGNSLAYLAVYNILQHKGMYNPIIIYGPHGCGKSVLLNSFVRQLRICAPHEHLVHFQCAGYIRQFANSLHQKTLGVFRQKCRYCDILILEDLDELLNKKASQQELLYTITTLIDRGAQLVASCREHPAKLPLLQSLRSLLYAGLILPMQKPSAQIRLQVLEELSRQHPLPVRHSALVEFADNFNGSLHELKSIFRNILSFSRQNRRGITPLLINQIVQGLTRKQAVNLETIARVVAAHCAISVEALLAPQGSRQVSIPRQVAMALARHLTSYTPAEIGTFFGGRKDSTVRRACRQTAQLPEQKSLFETLLCQLTAPGTGNSKLA